MSRYVVTYQLKHATWWSFLVKLGLKLRTRPAYRRLWKVLKGHFRATPLQRSVWDVPSYSGTEKELMKEILDKVKPMMRGDSIVVIKATAVAHEVILK